MENNIKEKKPTDAKLEAQKISFAPIAFQVTKTLRDLKILEIIDESGKQGIELNNILEKINISRYGIRVLLDAGISIGIVSLKDNKYKLTKTGYFIIKDDITKIHMDFVNDVCYQGMFFLDDAIKNKKPSGLKVFGEWKTIYEALSQLPAKVQESWFNFDHYFSDMAFPKVLPLIFKDNIKTMLDIGGNTGKWSIECAKYSKDVEITILDLPGQLKKAEENIRKNNFQDRIKLHEINILNDSNKFPTGFNAIWMSQFLDCFSEKEIISILKRAKDSMNDDSILYILETYTDRQCFNVATYCLDMISLYFTCLANGNSRMYHADDMIKCVNESGLEIVEDINGIAISHTLFKCKVKK